jgi:hypothetical protein
MARIGDGADGAGEQAWGRTAADPVHGIPAEASALSRAAAWGAEEVWRVWSPDVIGPRIYVSFRRQRSGQDKGSTGGGTYAARSRLIAAAAGEGKVPGGLPASLTLVPSGV